MGSLILSPRPGPKAISPARRTFRHSASWPPRRWSEQRPNSTFARGLCLYGFRRAATGPLPGPKTQSKINIHLRSEPSETTIGDTGANLPPTSHLRAHCIAAVSKLGCKQSSSGPKTPRTMASRSLKIPRVTRQHRPKPIAKHLSDAPSKLPRTPSHGSTFPGPPVVPKRPCQPASCWSENSPALPPRCASTAGKTSLSSFILLPRLWPRNSRATMLASGPETLSHLALATWDPAEQCLPAVSKFRLASPADPGPKTPQPIPASIRLSRQSVLKPPPFILHPSATATIKGRIRPLIRQIRQIRQISHTPAGGRGVADPACLGVAQRRREPVQGLIAKS
jgi:hypothetical protein